MRRRGIKSWLAILMATLGAAALTGCREDEQDRIIVFEQGVYRGNPHQPLSAEQVDELRSRALQQQY